MPRAPGSGKRQQGAASHRDTRHENGLVGPAKRSFDKKGTGQLDQGVAGAAGQSAPANGHTNSPYRQCVYDTSNDSRNDDPRRSSLDAVSEMSSDSSNANGLSVDAGHRQIDVNAMKNADVHRDSGPFDLATTVLKSLPMQDTLAILIILMHVPSLSLTIIYTIFTFLTFVPPVTTSSGMNINLAEIFDGISSMPSLVTVLCVDFFFLLIWLFLWGPIQDAILDFAKPVIAMTLGGGTSSAREGASTSLFTCFMWVVGHHLLRGTKAHWGRVARHIPEHWRLPHVFSNSLDPGSNVYDKRTAYGWVRSVLAIHILTQGIVRYIREWYLRREKANATVGASDPEAGKPPSVASDTANEGGFATPDTEAGLSSAQTVPTSKKRRKQSTQVRLQQPLWAALASTKIVVVKEYELSHAASESAGSNATDIHNLGNAPFNNQPSQIWISYIGSDEVCFNTSYFPEIDDDEPRSVESSGEDSRPSNIDTSKPFYVKVNNAVWQPTRMFPIEESPESGEGLRWTGDIYGLRPASKYVCEFVDSQTDVVLFSTSIRTVQATQREVDGVSPPVANGQRSLHPDSPATTLRTSIAAVEAKLSEERSRLKILRKEYKNRANALRKDNELTDNQLSSAGNHDEKYRQKIRQQETQKAQAERETQQLAEQLKNFDTAPELNERKKKVERQYSSEKKVFEAAQKAFKEHKSGLEKEIKAKEVEKSNLNTRRNKVATRIAKVENELANITDANNRGLDEAERRNQERAIWQGHVAGIEANYNERLAHVRANNANRSEELRHLEMQLHTFHDFVNSSNGMPYDMMPHPDAGPAQLGPPFQPSTSSTWNPNPNAPPHYPTGLWAGSGDILPSASAPTLPSMSSWQPPPIPSFEPRMTRSRGRSSSMLSNVSGFTQSSGEEYASPFMDPHRVKHIWASHTKASGGGSSGSGSNGDPTSPR
ncbi:hypothetical protein F66182_2817 [Fusarium sp. NRRL 66182]|nr:hypothetical protein F66182_2817 [Fusarium sp. NRRL 66182]